MNAVRIHKFGGGPQDLVYEEDVMQPHPKEGEVLMHTKWVTQKEKYESGNRTLTG
ncbi:MAG: hypothetical protein WCF03_12820 [Nitrososphaeraceae archaeon]